MEKNGRQLPMIRVAPDAGYWVDGARDDYESDSVDLFPPKGPIIELDVDNMAKTYWRSFVGRKHVTLIGTSSKLGEHLLSIKPHIVAGKDYIMILIRTSSGLTKKVIALSDNSPYITMIKNMIKQYGLEIFFLYPESIEFLIVDHDEHYVNRSKMTCAVFYQGHVKNLTKNSDKQAITAAFDDFLKHLGKRLSGRVLGCFRQRKIIFNISIFMPYTSSDELEEHCNLPFEGRETVAIVFREEAVITPFNVTSLYDTFIVVQPVQQTHYRLIVAAKNELSNFAPILPNPIVLPKGPSFSDFILTKVINADNACHKADLMKTTNNTDLLNCLINKLDDNGNEYLDFSS